LADQKLVNDLVTEVRFMVGREYVDKPESLSDYGLNPPGARLTVVAGADGVPQTLYLGWVNARGEKGGLFVKRDDASTVFVIDGHLLTLLPKTPDAFREKHLMTCAPGDLEAVHYKSSAAEFTLENRGEAGWAASALAPEENDPRAVSDFISFLHIVTAATFVEGGLNAEYGLDSPEIRIRLEGASLTGPREIRVGAAVPAPAPGAPRSYYATQDVGPIVTISERDVESLRKMPVDFRRNELLAFDPANVVKFSLQFEGRDYTFEKTDGKWRIASPSDKWLESQADVAMMLDALHKTNAVAVEPEEKTSADGAALGLDAPILVATLTVIEPEGGAEQTLGPLTIGNSANNDKHSRFATVAGRQSVFRVKQAVVDMVREAMRGVRSR